ncbi:MAG: hypothetical protein FWG90_01995 [Oscillospiraceae bacterium]|nr:hypothetical protein [Oscillospiraceae bacterium]
MMDVGIWLILHAMAELYGQLVSVINGLLSAAWDITMQAGMSTDGLGQAAQQGFADFRILHSFFAFNYRVLFRNRNIQRSEN